MDLTPSSIYNYYLPDSLRAVTAGEQFRVTKKRKRVPINCSLCRVRKWKCDRNRPCSNCVRQGGAETTTCVYSAPVASETGDSEANSESLKYRLNRLEDLVLTLMRGEAVVDARSTSAVISTGSTSRMGNGESSTEAHRGRTPENTRAEGGDIDDLATSLGVLSIEPKNGNAVYIGQEHWQTILADILEIKASSAKYDQELEASYEEIRLSKPLSASAGITLLHGTAPPATEFELQAALPSRIVILTLCSRYFESIDNPVVIIHSGAFYEELYSHWENPSKTPLMWLGLLYSILCLGMLSYHRVGDEPTAWKGRTLEMAVSYRLRTAQCLLVADYTKPVVPVVETMLLYTFGEYGTRWDIDMELWLLVSTVTRIAIQMGYHRDGKWFPCLSPFKAEMRRRTWALLTMADVMFSHQVSLPSMIHNHHCDTREPVNLFQEEINPMMESLPPSRSKEEITPSSYMIAKVKLCRVMSDILHATNRVDGLTSYEEVLRFDTELRQIYDDLPEHLTGLPLQSPHETAKVVANRFSINSLYRKIVCLLHKKHLSLGRRNSRYAYSRRSAIGAASETLEHLAVLIRESQPGGRFQSLIWFVKSMATKEFLTCAMIVARDLYHDYKADDENLRSNTDTSSFWTSEQTMKMKIDLEMTKDFWKSLADDSKEALRASKMLEIILAHINSTVVATKRTESLGDTTLPPTNISLNTRADQTAVNDLGSSVIHDMPLFDETTQPLDPISIAQFDGMAPSSHGTHTINNFPDSQFSMFGSIDVDSDFAAIIMGLQAQQGKGPSLD
ncbi:fungal-specific transcription factor domain-containing protein [Fusarium avenaceum]|nr:fungal-specific transcription factor domain-containing protein [Fusarium avenaceum]